MFRKITVFLMSLLLAFSLLPSASKAAGPVKIGTISLQKIMENSAAAVAAQKKLKEKAAEFSAKLDVDNTALQKMQDEITKKESVWSSEVRAEKERDYQKQLRDFKTKQEDAQFELDQLKAKIMGPILKDLQASIAAVGKNNGYTIILENSRKGIQSQIGLMYADENIDVSDLVQKELDKRTAAAKKK